MARRLPRARRSGLVSRCRTHARPRSVGTLALPDLTLAAAHATGLIEVGRTVITPDECDERGEFLPRHQFGRYSDGAPLLWNHLGFDRAAMQDRQEGSVVVEMLNHYRRPLRAGDLAVVMSGLAAFTDKVLIFTHFLFEAETGTLAACAEAVGMKFDQKIRKIMTFPRRGPGAPRRAPAPALRRTDGREDEDRCRHRRRPAGLKYDDKRLAEIAAEVEVLNDAVRKAAACPPHLRRRSGGVRQRHGEGSHAREERRSRALAS